MFRTDSTVGLLRAIALIAGLAILLWSLGLPSLQFARAASVSLFSDTLTDSSPSAASDHIVAFTMSDTGSVASSGGTIDITFPGTFSFGSLAITDVSINVGGSNDDANWTVSLPGGNVVRLTAGAGGGVASSEAVIVSVGTSTANQISNPSSEGTYDITVAAGTDTGTTKVVIMSSVQVTASVDTVFTFAVAGVNAGVTINTGETTTGTTSSTSIPFGKLQNGSATTSAQQLSVVTNASNGYTVTVQTDGPLESTTGGIIDGYSSESDSPLAWTAPTPDVNDATTWGYWGVTSDDATTTSRSSQFSGNSATYIAASTTPRVVMEHNGPANGSGTGIGTTYVGYKVEISALQEAGDDYSTTITYIATPTF